MANEPVIPPELKKDALLLGALDCLSKPVNFDELAPKVLELLARAK